MEDSKQATYFDWLAPLYDDATEKIGWFPNRELKDLITQYLITGLKVLDIGIGTGQTAEIFLANNCHVTGTDISEEMLVLAHKKFPSIDLYKVDLSNADKLPFEENQFDLVACVGTFEFIKDTENFLTVVKKVLKPGGFFCFTFEKLVEGSDTQSERASPLGTQNTEFLPDTSFFVYRYTEEEIQKSILKHGLVYKDSKSFVGYYRGAEKQPVQYGMVLSVNSKK
jgi:ubiquinone/menaquinone biosynthesis C-methylase UbiE